MRGIRVLNVNLDKNTAIIYVKGKPFEVGTQEFVSFLDNAIQDISVDLVSDWELTLFELHKNSKNEWVASRNKLEEVVFVGKSENITYSRIIEIDDYFQELAKKTRGESKSS